jgi:hypothetical protein
LAFSLGLPLGIYLAKEENQYGSTSDGDCKPQDQSGKDVQDRDQGFHICSHLEPALHFPAMYAIAKSNEQGKRNHQSDEEQKG